MIYLLSKLLPLLILPLGLTLALLLIAYFSRKRIFIFSSITILWLFSTGIVSEALFRLIESPWERRNVKNVPLSSAIVVLSGSRHPAPGKDQINEWTDPDRFFAGIKLFKAGKAPRILFTGGVNPYYGGVTPEGALYLKEAELLGVPKQAMQSTPPLVNTAEEASAIRKLIRDSANSSPPRIILVTSAFHMQRAQKMFERQGLAVVPFPVDFKTRGQWAGNRLKDPIQWFPNASYLNLSTQAVREMIGRIVYRAW